MFKIGPSHGQRLVFVVIVMLVLAAIACGPTGSATEAPAKQPETEAPATEEPTEESSGSEGTVSLDIENESGTDICEVYVAVIDDKSWGDDQLGEKKILAGETFTLNKIPEGLYDLQALDCDGNVVSRAVKQDLSGSDFTWTVGSNTISLTINNNSDSIGCKIYVAEPDDKYWGPNLVDEGETIAPGGGYIISGIEPGVHDIHAETCSGNYEWDWEDIDLTSDAEINMTN